MVCVAVKGVPIIGVIHKPFEGITAWGWVGPNLISDALRQNLEDSSRVDLEKSRLIVSRSHAGSVHDVAAKLFGPDVQVKHFVQFADFVYKRLCLCLSSKHAYNQISLCGYMVNEFKEPANNGRYNRLTLVINILKINSHLEPKFRYCLVRYIETFRFN